MTKPFNNNPQPATLRRNNPLVGMHYLFRGFQLLCSRKLRHFIYIPVTINLLLFVLMIIFGFHAIALLAHHLPHWLHWLAWVIQTLFVIISPIILVYLFTIITNLIGAPFNSLLSEKVEKLMAGHSTTETTHWQAVLKDLPRTLKREWHKILYYLPRMVLLLILFIIPLINAIAGILWFVFSCWMMAIEYLDYPMDNHKWTFQKTKHSLSSHRYTSFGFGLGVMISSMIPFVNFVVMPAAVIGATLMWLEQHANTDAIQTANVSKIG